MDDKERAYSRAVSLGEPGARARYGRFLADRDDWYGALTWFRQGAELGESSCLSELGGHLGRIGESEGAELFHQAAAASDDDMVWARPRSAQGAPPRGQVGERSESTFDRVQAAAAEGGVTHDRATSVVLFLRRGYPEEARRWWQAAAENGSTDAMVELGRRYAADGDRSEAMRWFRKAATAGDRFGELNLGHSLKSVGNHGGAARWYQRGAKRDDSAAMFALGDLHADRGNRRRGEHWLRAAAQAGHVRAMIRLGRLIASTEAAEAGHWYRIAASAGDTSAMTALGAQLAFRNPDHAEYWYRRAADWHDTTARISLFHMLQRQGRYQEATKWRPRY